MNTRPSTPIQAVDQRDEIVPYSPVPDSRINFADDPDALAYVQQHIVPLMIQVRDDGTSIRDEWHQIQNMTMLKHDDNQAYKGMSKAYVPVYAHALNTKVSHVSRGVFPSDDYIDVQCLDGQAMWAPDPSHNNLSQSDVLKAWMRYQFEKQLRLRTTIKPFLRQLYNYGISVGKVWYDKPLRPRLQGRSRRGLPSMESVLMDYSGMYSARCEGVRFQARNMFTWHMWPATANSIAEATLVFEDIQVSKQFIEESGKIQGWKNLEHAIWSPQPSNSNSDLQLQMDAIRNSPSTAVDFQRLGEKGHFSYITEAWFTMPVPKDLYRQGEDPSWHVPVRALFAGSIPVLLQRNPFWFQHAPYVVQRLNDTPDAFNGVGMGRYAMGLQHLINDFTNQTNDNATYALNPILLANPSLMVGPMDPLAPGRIYPTTDPANAIKFERPPVEQIQYSMQVVNWLMTQLNDLNGTPPILQGSSTKGAAKTATGAQLLQQNVRTDLQDDIEDIELEVMIPLMEMVHVLGQQYQDKALQVAISGGTINVRPGDLAGEFAYQWLASTQQANQQLRSQQAMQLLQMVPPLIPLLQQHGVNFNPMPLLRRIGKEGMGFRDFDSCFEQMTAPVTPGAIPGQPGQSVPIDSNIRSAVEQAPGGGTDIQPGEGDAFASVRDNADELASMMGG